MTSFDNNGYWTHQVTGSFTIHLYFNYCIFSAYFFDILHMADFDIQRQAGGSFSSCQDVEVPMLRDEAAPFASAPTAIQKGVTLQRYVETCRECLESTMRKADHV